VVYEEGQGQHDTNTVSRQGGGHQFCNIAYLEGILKDFSYNFDEGLFFKLVMTRAIYFNSIPENFQYLYGFRVIVLKLLL
jgi:hypothetical protein